MFQDGQVIECSQVSEVRNGFAPKVSRRREKIYTLNITLLGPLVVRHIHTLAKNCPYDVVLFYAMTHTQYL